MNTGSVERLDATNLFPTVAMIVVLVSGALLGHIWWQSRKAHQAVTGLQVQAREIGKRAAYEQPATRDSSVGRRDPRLGRRFRSWRGSAEVRDHAHQPGGNDIGRLMGEAYRRRGASGAVDVLDSYLAGFEAERSACGLPALDLNDIAHNLDWPASIEADPDQIAEIRAAFVGRRNLA